MSNTFKKEKNILDGFKNIASTLDLLSRKIPEEMKSPLIEGAPPMGAYTKEKGREIDLDIYKARQKEETWTTWAFGGTITNVVIGRIKDNIVSAFNGLGLGDVGTFIGNLIYNADSDIEWKKGISSKGGPLYTIVMKNMRVGQDLKTGKPKNGIDSPNPLLKVDGHIMYEDITKEQKEKEKAKK